MTEPSLERPESFQTPVGAVLHRCRRVFWFVAAMSFVIELLALAPIIYMWNAFDRVLTSRSMVTLVSLTVIVLGVYVLWSVLDWLRTRMLIRLSMRLDWDLATDVFDASFRQMASRRRVNVQQMMTDTLELRQFLSGKGLILERQKKYSAAREAYEQALAINPNLEVIQAALKELDRLEQGI